MYLWDLVGAILWHQLVYGSILFVRLKYNFHLKYNVQLFSSIDIIYFVLGGDRCWTSLNISILFNIKNFVFTINNYYEPFSEYS